MDTTDTDIDLRAILGLLRRRMRLILTTLLLVIGVTGIAVLSLTPIYSASTLVLVDPSHKDLLDPQANMMGQSADNARVDSEVEIVKSDSVLMDVVKNLKLVDDDEFGPKIGLRDQILARMHIKTAAAPDADAALRQVLDGLGRATSVRRIGLTYLISIEARSRSPQKAARIANAIATAYIANQLDSKIDSALASRDVLQKRIAQASAAIVNSEKAFDAYLADNIDKITQETGRTDIADMRDQLEQANATLANAQQVASSLDADLKRKDWGAVATQLKSDVAAKLEAQRESLVDGMRKAVAGSAESQSLHAQLARIEQQLSTQASTELKTLQQSVTDSDGRATDLRQKIRTTVMNSNLPPEVLSHIYELQQGSEVARSQYQTLLTRLKDVEAQADLQVADSRVVSPALPPNVAAFPNTRLILVMSALTALGLGVGLAFLYEHYIGGFTSEGQVEAVLHTRVVSAIPRLRSAPRDADGEALVSVADLMTTQPLSVFSEAIRRVRAAIDQIVRHRPGITPDKRQGLVIMVSSAAPGDGKTTLALAMARAYALSGRRTLLIDGDLRKPTIHHQIGTQSSSGLIDYLTKAPDSEYLANILSRDESTGVSVILGARRSDMPTDQLVSGSAFARLLQQAREHFDYIVIDTPPVGPVVDALYMAQYADVVAFIVRWASTAQAEARNALSSLQAAMRPDAQCVAVLNQQERQSVGYKDRYASYYAYAS
ncbi:MAG TPA: Wzz/FepE/Etk N-terminal domain-containing protein [Devosiaceae bacterium]